MPKRDFICPDDTPVSIEQCRTQCRMLKRCAPMPYLEACAHERPWTGKPSVTQLIKGTREAYLMIVKPYAIRPADEAFALFGTGIHKALEEFSPTKYREIALSMELDDGTVITGNADYIEPVGEKMFKLIDYKTSGAFKVKKALGMKTRTETLINGEKRKVVEYVPEDADMDDWKLQLNMYRIMLERERPDISIPSIGIFSVVRDGGLQATRNYGIESNIYDIPVPIMDEETVLSYFRKKAKLLITCLELHTPPKKCSHAECWGGRKCSNYCSVYEYCGGYDG